MCKAISISLYQYVLSRTLPVIDSDSIHYVEELAKDVHYVVKVNFIGVLFIRL